MSITPLFIMGDARRLAMADASVQTVITSPPYFGLRDYGYAGQIGLEATPDAFVAALVEVFREVRRVLRPDGTLWLNLGDSYNAYNTNRGPSKSLSARVERAIPKVAGGADGQAGFQPLRRDDDDRQSGNDGNDSGGASRCSGRNLSGQASGRVQVLESRLGDGSLKPKDLLGIPWKVAFALQADGWWLRDVIIWHKPNPMPSSVTDRTTTAHEYVFLLTKSARYFYDADAIREPVTSTGGACVGKQKISADGTGAQSRKFADPSERNNPLGRNKRSVWTIPTFAFPGAHFATFPPRLVEPMIRAGTSEKGCCPACRSPWKRVVERVPTGAMHKAPDGWDTGDGAHGTIHRDGREAGATGVPVMATVTVAWTPTCKCHGGAPVPCTVLDPFGGACTTAMVAAKLGRRGISVDRNAEYLALGRTRIAEELSKPAKKPKRKREPKPERDLFTLEVA